MPKIEYMVGFGSDGAAPCYKRIEWERLIVEGEVFVDLQTGYQYTVTAVAGTPPENSRIITSRGDKVSAALLDELQRKAGYVPEDSKPLNDFYLITGNGSSALRAK